MRTRVIQTQPQCDGASRPGLVESRVRVNNPCCPVDCAITQWTPFSPCSTSCGEVGTQTRTRQVGVRVARCGRETEPRRIGSDLTRLDPIADPSSLSTPLEPRSILPCPALSEAVNCDPGCCTADCSVSAWSQWGACTKSCGGGTEQRTRQLLINPSCSGVGCPSLSETRPCNQQCCSVGTIESRHIRTNGRMQSADVC